MSHLRTFIALDLSPSVKAKIHEIQEELASTPSDVRWVGSEGLHLTLKFLGSVEEGEIADISSLIAHCAAATPPFTLQVRSLGAFPSERNPKVIWAGAEDKSGVLTQLYHSLETSLATAGFKEEKRSFTPHLTLGRVKSHRGKKELVQKIAHYHHWECGECNVVEVILFKSDLTPQGALYTKLKTFPLRSRPDNQSNFYHTSTREGKHGAR